MPRARHPRARSRSESRWHAGEGTPRQGPNQNHRRIMGVTVTVTLSFGLGMGLQLTWPAPRKSCDRRTSEDQPRASRRLQLDLKSESVATVSLQFFSFSRNIFNKKKMNGRGIRPVYGGGPPGRIPNGSTDHMAPINRPRMHGNAGMPVHMDGTPIAPSVLNNMIQVGMMKSQHFWSHQMELSI